jgi:hypothetical protein
MERVDYQSLIIQDLINLKKKDELNLNPWYQRRSVWNDSQKSYLINTLFERKPIPAIYIRHSLDLEKGKSIKEVVDGQQRSRAIIGYCNNEFSAIFPENQKRVKYDNLTASQKQSFLLTPIPVGYLQGADDADVIDIFARINSVAKTLNAQEKRNAIFSGYFKQLSVKESVKRLAFWRQYEVFSANDIARMAEVQFISDIIVNFLDGLTNYNSSKLNKYYKKYDFEFDKANEMSSRLEKVFNYLINIEPNSIKETIFKRPPLFFSLIVVLDQLKKVDLKKLETGLFKIDEIFNSDVPVSEREKEDIEFYNASSSTTQGMSQRQIRNDYIKSFIK